MSILLDMLVLLVKLVQGVLNRQQTAVLLLLRLNFWELGDLAPATLVIYAIQSCIYAYAINVCQGVARRFTVCGK